VGRILRPFVGAVIGLVCGAVMGMIIGGGIDLLLGNWLGWRAIFGGVVGFGTGLIAGIGTGLMGSRTRFGLEWLPMILVGVPLGLLLMEGSWNWANLLLIGGIGAVSGWLAGLVVKVVLRKWLPGEVFQDWMLAGYLTVFVGLIIIVPRLLKLLAMAIAY